MEVYCQGCAGCCLDWRPLVDDAGDAPPSSPDTNRRRRRAAIDDVYNLVPLTRDEIRGFLEDGFGNVLIPRLWEADDRDDSVSIDGYEVAAIGGRPAFFVGLRKPPKPLAPFGLEDPAWLPTCVFLDPATLQCRIYGGERYPDECGAYPAYNVSLEQDTECERVERTVDDRNRIRLESNSHPNDDDPSEAADVPEQADRSYTGEGHRISGDSSEREAASHAITVDPESVGRPLFGPQAIGQKLFTHPDPDDLEGRIERLVAGEQTPADRAAFVAVAAASAPGTVAISAPHRAQATEHVLEASSWAGEAIRAWHDRAPDRERYGTATTADPAALGDELEVARGAPETPGWETDERAEPDSDA